MKHNPLPSAKLGKLWMILSSLIVGISHVSYAQTETEVTDEDTYELSPFVIETDENVGYLATQTLAGTRIKTKLRDLGGAIDVVTEEFMEDTGATDVESLFTYTMGTEVGGMQGNFSAADIGGTAGKPNLDAVQREPQQGARVRGLGRPNYTRSYFSTSIPIDGYNTGGITISRGPNSILFGLGEPAGVVDAGLKIATIGSDNGRVQLRFGSYGAFRANADYSKTVIEDRLAIRVAGLYEDKKYRQEEAEERKNRAYMAFTGVLFKNEKSSFLGRTTVRGNIEVGDIQRTPPTNMAPTIAYESFFAPPPDYRSYNGGRDYPQTYDWLAANWEPWKIVDTLRIDNGDGTYSPGWYEQGNNAHPNYDPSLVTPVYSTPHIYTQVGIVYSGDGDPSLHANGDTLFSGWVSAPYQNQSPFIQTRIYTEQANGTGFKPFNITDRNVFDYKNHLITGDLQQINNDFDSYNLTLEQQLFDGKAGVEAAFAKERYYIDWFQPFGTDSGHRNNPVYIDTTMYLSDGRQNPNAGRALLMSNGFQERWRETDRTNYRVTAFGELDFTDSSKNWMKWLGRHRFTGLYQVEERRQVGMNAGYYWDGVNANFNRVVNNNGSNNKRPFFLQTVMLGYISDNNVGKSMDEVRLNPLNIDMFEEGDTYTGVIFNKQTQEFESHTAVVNKINNGVAAGGEDVTSEAFAWQPYLFSDHLVGMLGWRRDEIDSYGRIFPERSSATNEVLEDNMRLQKTSAEPAVGETLTYSIVAHVPQKWIDFQDVVSSVSFHYSEAENFQAIQQRHDIYNNSIESPQGVTEEMGFTVGFNNDKWLVRVNHFETSSKNNGTLGSATSSAQSWIGGWLQRYQDGENGGVPFESLPISTRGYNSYADVYEAILALQPEPARSIYDWQYDAEQGEWDNQGSIRSLSSTRDVVSKGWEVDLTANPTNNWRVKLNISQIETTNSNTGQALFEYSNELMTNLERANLIGVPEGTDSIVPFEQRFTSAVLTGLASERAKDGAVSQEAREWRINLITNYSFRDGKMKGLSVGGAIRWGSAVTIGYEQKLDEFNNLVPNLDRPFEGDDDLRGDVWVSYGKKLPFADWKVQLNIRNAIGDQGDIPIWANPDGQRSLYRIAPATEWFLTNTFSF